MPTSSFSNEPFPLYQEKDAFEKAGRLQETLQISKSKKHTTYFKVHVYPYEI